VDDIQPACMSRLQNLERSVAHYGMQLIYCTKYYMQLWWILREQRTRKGIEADGTAQMTEGGSILRILCEAGRCGRSYGNLCGFRRYRRLQYLFQSISEDLAHADGRLGRCLHEQRSHASRVSCGFCSTNLPSMSL